jgi:hypothetical protein
MTLEVPSHTSHKKYVESLSTSLIATTNAFYLQACDKLFGTNAVPVHFHIQINGKEILVHPPNANSHFEHVNLLGADFCTLSRMKINIDYDEKTTTMRFPSDLFPST